MRTATAINLRDPISAETLVSPPRRGGVTATLTACHKKPARAPLPPLLCSHAADGEVGPPRRHPGREPRAKVLARLIGRLLYPTTDWTKLTSETPRLLPGTKQVAGRTTNNLKIIVEIIKIIIERIIIIAIMILIIILK